MDIKIGVEKTQRIHFIGIGGVSMSALAELLFYSGYPVTGSDARESVNTEKLAACGINVTIGHDEENVRGADVIVYTDAISKDNPEMQLAVREGKRMIDRGTLLGMVSGCFSSGIAISGTHGKTTSSSMTAAVFLAAGLDPTVHIGADVKGIAAGIRMGGTRYLISEACEYKRNFLKLSYETAVVLNVDVDHLDYFKGMEDIQDAYLSFLNAAGKYTIVNGDDIVLRSKRELFKGCTTFGIKTVCDYRAENVESDEIGKYSFTLVERGERLGTVHLGVIGQHNVYNALAACAAARLYGVDFCDIRKGLESFCGADRRMEHKGSVNGANVILDYAHHPSEIRAVLDAVKHVPYQRLIVVFEPHTYTRLQGLFSEFAKCFRGADFVLLANVYAAREKKIRGVNSRALVSELKRRGQKAALGGSYERIAVWVSKYVKSGDLLLILGAGDIDKVWKLIHGRNALVPSGSRRTE